ncbi:MAG: arsenate reductase ArsC [Saprospiraceae bacterium]|nr:arsenate reductase ArsC [Saprospiraceae bacterium]MCB9355105.1 arsenate reductase ArsC [Lewinellaceae bacterium]
MKQKNILVLCTGNSCRSQMAHGYLEHFAGDRARIYSAGVETHGLNPRAVAAMMEDGIYIAHHRSHHVDEYRNIPFDVVITVCDHANEQCPIFPGAVERLHQNFPDPAKATGSEAEIRQQFRDVRDRIRDWCRTFVETRLQE